MALLLALLLAASPARALPDAALGAALDARSAAGAAGVFDGTRGRLGVPDPVVVDEEPARRAALPAAEAAADPAPRSAPEVRPAPMRGLTAGRLGLYPESDFVVGTGRCAECRGPREGKWYFLDEVIATPKTGPEALVWIGSPEMVEGGVLSSDGRTLSLPGGSAAGFALTPRLATNRSYWNPASLESLEGRPLRLRGETVERDGVPTFVARTVWPEDWRLDLAAKVTADAATASEVDALVAADKGGAKGPFQSKLLWARSGSAAGLEGRPVMGFMLNGAQGDDDESLGGHFSMFTGVVGPGGSMADWMFDNFYDMDSVSEKGIVAGLVPMDKYMGDLNSGQSWYRPSYLVVLVMKDPAVPLRMQEAFKERYARYYDHSLRYDHTRNPCTGLVVDEVRAQGWRFPETGKTPSLVARAVAAAAGLGSKDPNASAELYEVLRQEGTHLYPRAAFGSLAGDALAMTGAYGTEPAGREYGPLEREVRDGLEAVYFVRIPQFPSSRALGRDPVTGFMDYFGRVPMDRSKWQVVPTQPRPYPPPH